MRPSVALASYGGTVSTSAVMTPKRAVRGLAIGVVITALVAVGAFFAIRRYVLEPFYIPSASMEPTLHGCPGCQPDRVLVEKLTYRFHDPRRGDVIVFTKPASLRASEPDLIKRVIGLPGDAVSAHNGSVYVGDRRLDEPYVNPACNGTANFTAVTVPQGQLFVMGDNRCNSLDSRSFGPIVSSTVVGRAAVIVWPLNRIHWL